MGKCGVGGMVKVVCGGWRNGGGRVWASVGLEEWWR